MKNADDGRLQSTTDRRKTALEKVEEGISKLSDDIWIPSFLLRFICLQNQRRETGLFCTAAVTLAVTLLGLVDLLLFCCRGRIIALVVHAAEYVLLDIVFFFEDV